MSMLNKYGAIGAVYALLAVAFGAFGAHGLKDVLDEDMLEVFETGVRYQMYHALGILVVAVLSDRVGKAVLLRRGAMLLHIGIIVFSGSLYVLSLSGIKVLGAITPIGGVCFLAGWAMIAWALWSSRTDSRSAK